ncbi:MAG TPA: efflux RND transporter periplasmic adaptor subunit [Steroidobacteraceae bacterium]|jgi:RND family efflux transporter MFP subunit|nr:efflux RND transporter periplasmic adaptor subunit [Steroidobacteraceae bacterium]
MSQRDGAQPEAPASLGAADKLLLLKSLRLDSAQRDSVGPSRRWLLPAGIAAGLLLAIAVAVWLLRPAHHLAVKVTTAAAPLAGGKDTAVLQATGYVTARREATVSAQITGTVTDVLIEEGDSVKAGQVLAHLDSTAQRAQLAQAQAQYLSAQATLPQTEVQLAQARRDLTRQEGLMANQLTSQQALEDAQTRVATASAQVEIQHKQLELGSAAVQAAQVQFNYATVRAPFDGVVIAKSAQVGEIVSPFSAGGGFTRTGIGTIVDMNSLEIEVDVNESYIDRIVSGQGAEAVLDAYPAWTIPAHVIAIIPTADRGKATVKVRVAFDARDPRILPDMGVRVSFLQSVRPATAGAASAPAPGVLVPASAVLQRDAHAAVFVLDGSKVRMVSVTPRGELGEMRQVEGIAAGAQVVIAPPAELADGATVDWSEAGK